MSEAQRHIGEGLAAVCEAMGGFWQMTNEQPTTFIPLDEFISKKFLEDVEGDLAKHDLVLEDEF